MSGSLTGGPWMLIQRAERVVANASRSHASCSEAADSRGHVSECLFTRDGRWAQPTLMSRDKRSSSSSRCTTLLEHWNLSNFWGRHRPRPCKRSNPQIRPENGKAMREKPESRSAAWPLVQQASCCLMLLSCRKTAPKSSLGYKACYRIWW